MGTQTELAPLMIACQNNNPEEIKNLLAKKVDVDYKDLSNRTALFYCADHTDTTCIDLLVKAKANVNHQDKDGYACLHISIICGNSVIVDYLIKNGADINIVDSELHSAIHWAVVCAHDQIFDFLIEKNADPESADIHGAYPIHYAAQMCGEIDIWDETLNRNMAKSLVILKKLIKQRVKIDVEDYDQRNAFIWAASSGSSDALLELYKAGSDCNKHEKDGLTALHCAASRGHIDCIKFLIEHCKCSVDIMDNNNCTPIFYAATLGQDEACELLISYNANLHVQDCKGRSVYHCAAAKGQLKCLKAICKKNPNIWLRNRRGDYPIHEAYYSKQMEIVNYLLDTINDKRAAKSFNMYDGRTILHLAAADNDLKLCKKLISCGAEINNLMKSSVNSYLTAYDVAVLKKANECAKYLKNVGGEVGNEIAEKTGKLVKNGNDQETTPIKEISNSNNNTTKNNKVKDVNKKSNAPLNPANDNRLPSPNSKAKTPKNTPNKEKTTSTSKTIKNNDSTNSKLNNNKNIKLNKFSLVSNINTNENLDNYDDQEYDFKPSDYHTKEERKLKDTSAQTMIYGSTNQKLIMLKQGSFETFSSQSDDEDEINPKANGLRVSGGSKKKLSKKKSSGKLNIKKNDISEKENKKTFDNPIEPIHNGSNSNTKYASNINNNSLNKRSNSKQKFTKNDGSNLQENPSTFNNVSEPTEAELLRETEKKAKLDAEKEEREKRKENRTKDLSAAYGKIVPILKLKNKNDSRDEKVNSSNKFFNVRKSNEENNSTNNNLNDFSDENDASIFVSSPERTTKNENANKRFKNNRPPLSNAFDKRTSHEQPRPIYNEQDLAMDDNTVKVIVKGDVLDSATWAKKKYSNLFDRQRLILKSLYDIRRCRINNRDIIVSSDLNNLLLKSYNFDVKKNCKSLKDLEKTLEVIALEISDECKKQNQNKRSHTLVSIKMKNQSFENGQWKSSDNITTTRTESDRSKPLNLKLSESNAKTDNDRSKSEKVQSNQDHLKIAYKSLLPNDIYKQYYGTTKPKYSSKEQSPRNENTIILPVIAPKSNLST